ncbi:unnamed protein product [Heterobilharzia americana]|nr:unnamed protein product [Heterobilharzia americana]
MITCYLIDAEHSADSLKSFKLIKNQKNSSRSHFTEVRTIKRLRLDLRFQLTTSYYHSNLFTIRCMQTFASSYDLLHVLCFKSELYSPIHPPHSSCFCRHKTFRS